MDGLYLSLDAVPAVREAIFLKIFRGVAGETFKESYDNALDLGLSNTHFAIIYTRNKYQLLHYYLEADMGRESLRWAAVKIFAGWMS